MDRHILAAVFALSAASPAFGQCQLCAPDSAATPAARAIPLSIAVEAALDLGRAAQTRVGGGGTISIDPQTGARRVTGTLADLGGFSLKGTVRLTGEPFAPVIVTLPSRISLTSVDGSTADVVDIRTDLPSGAVLNAQGSLSFGFGGRLIITAGQAGDFRGRIAVSAEYR
jgi:Domain of unknown function (DUF4402)